MTDSEKIIRLETAFEGHQASDKDKHEELERRLHDANQWREQLTHERTTYLTRDLYDREHANVLTRVSALEERLALRISALELGASRASGSLWMLGAALSAVMALVTLLSKFY